MNKSTTEVPYFTQLAQQAAELYPQYAGWECFLATRDVDYVATSAHEVFDAAVSVHEVGGDTFNDEEIAEHFHTFDLPTGVIGVALRHPTDATQKQVFLLLTPKA